MLFEQDGRVQEYVGDYSDWLRQGHQLTQTDSPEVTASNKRAAAASTAKKVRKKLSYNDQRELDLLPGKIESLESEIAALQDAVSHASFYSQKKVAVQETLKLLNDSEARLETLVQRWGELETSQTLLI